MGNTLEAITKKLEFQYQLDQNCIGKQVQEAKNLPIWLHSTFRYNEVITIVDSLGGYGLGKY